MKSMEQEQISLRKKQAMVTRQTIFDVGHDLILKKGFYKVTVDDICLEAGVSKGTFYSYFKSKEELVFQQVIKMDDYYANVLPKLVAKKKTTHEKMMMIANCALTNIAKNIGIANTKVAFQSQIAVEMDYSKMASESRPLFTLIKDVTEEGQRNGTIRIDVKSDEITRMWLRVMRGLIFDWCLTNGKFDLVKEGRKMFEMVEGGIQTK